MDLYWADYLKVWHGVQIVHHCRRENFHTVYIAACAENGHLAHSGKLNPNSFEWNMVHVVAQNVWHQNSNGKWILKFTSKFSHFWGNRAGTLQFSKFARKFSSAVCFETFWAAVSWNQRNNRSYINYINYIHQDMHLLFLWSECL
jgi:hypothetical protein